MKDGYEVEFYQGDYFDSMMGRRVSGLWYWRLVCKRNGRIMADGAEGYDSKSNAKRGFKRVVEVLQRDQSGSE